MRTSQALAEKIRSAYTDPSVKEIYIGIPRRVLNVTSLPGDILTELQNLEKITISLPALTVFPELTRPLPNLKKLWLHNCRNLANVPDNFAQLIPNLEHLNCWSSSQLVVRADHISALHHLAGLNLARTATDVQALLHDLPRLSHLIGATGVPVTLENGRQTTNVFRSVREPARFSTSQMNIVDIEIEQALTKIPASKIWPKADFDAYIKKIISECVPRYFSKNTVLKVLNAASDNSALCEQLFSIALSADLRKCTDNRVRTFNDMQVAVKIAGTLVENKSSEIDKSRALLTVLRQHYRNHLLSVFAEKTVGKIAELVEVELFFRYRLKHQLALPCPVEHMLNWKYAEMMIAPSTSRSGSADLVKVTQVLNSAENFVLEQEKDNEALAFWLLDDINWQAWVGPKISTDIAGVESRLQQKTIALDNIFNQLSDAAQDEQLITYAEQKRRLEEQCRQEKFECMFKQTMTIIDEVAATPVALPLLGQVVQGFVSLTNWFKNLSRS